MIQTEQKEASTSKDVNKVSPMISVGKVFMRIGHALIIGGILMLLFAYSTSNSNYELSAAFIFIIAVALALVFYLFGAIIENIWFRNE